MASVSSIDAAPGLAWSEGEGGGIGWGVVRGGITGLRRCRRRRQKQRRQQPAPLHESAPPRGCATRIRVARRRGMGAAWCVWSLWWWLVAGLQLAAALWSKYGDSEEGRRKAGAEKKKGQSKKEVGLLRGWG